MTARRNQLLILLLFFGLSGIFAGIVLWQINQSQQRERELLQVKTELEQTNQQMQILKQQSNAALSTRSKLQKDLITVKKQLDTASQKNATLEQNLKTAQTQSSSLATENSSLKSRLTAAEQQVKSLSSSLSGSLKKSSSPQAQPALPINQ